MSRNPAIRATSSRRSGRSASGGVFLPAAIAQSVAFAGPALCPEPAVETDVARDRDLAPARRRQKSFRDRVAGPFVLQDDRQYLFHHSPEARLALILRTGALRDRDPPGVKLEVSFRRHRSQPAPPARAFRRRSTRSMPWLRAPRGGGSDFSRMMCVGRSDRKNRRSASWTASARSWVTNSVVTFVRVVSATSSSRNRAATASSSDTKGSSSSRKSGRTANARAMATRRASPSDNSPGYRAR